MAAKAISQEVDAEEGVIHGVSILTLGPAIGHGTWIDSTTLAQFMGIAQTFRDGIRSKINHGPDAMSIVGAVRNFRMSEDGTQLVGDLHLLKTHRAFKQIVGLAKEFPTAFGLSVSFSGMPEDKDGKMMARVSEIYSIDIVDEPAANPDGLFRAKVDFRAKDMTTKDESKDTQPASILSQIKALLGITDKKPDETETKLRSDLDAATKERTELAVKFAAQEESHKVEIAKLKADHDAALKAKDTAVEELVSKRAAELLAKTGNPNPVPGQKGQGTATAKDELWAQYNALKTPAEKTTFWRKHRDQLVPA